MIDKKKFNEIFPPSELLCAESIDKIGDLIVDDVFLAGLGRNVKELGYNNSSPVITDLTDFQYLTAGPAYGKENEKQFDGYTESFAEIVAMFDYTTGIKLTPQARLEIYPVMSKSNADFHPEFYISVQEKLRENGFNEIAMEQLAGDQKVASRYIDLVVSEIDAYIGSMIQVAYFGGFEKWPFSMQMYNLFMTGGLPCGWLGPDPVEVSDDEQASYMRVLHFGAATAS